MGDIAALGGHRAVTHSVFAALLGGLGASYAWRRRFRREGEILRVFAFVTLVILSHGLLDTMATYGDGVAFFAPLSLTRYDSPWKPFSGILGEIVGLWIPAALMIAYLRRSRPLRGSAVVLDVP